MENKTRASLFYVLVGAVIGSAAATALTLSLYRRDSDQSLKTTPRNGTKNGHPNGRRRKIPAELRKEQLSRHTLYFGEEGMEGLRSAKICVVGLGGVGSHTVHMLARAGIGYLRIIDFDQVTLSSLNRHACATLDDVGIPKATCLERFVTKLCPDPAYFQVDAVVQMYTKESSDALLGDTDWDIVIDAIDDVPTKAHLLNYCLDRGIRVISCMGAGGKSDVTRLHISDLRTAAKDPLASKIRQTLKRLRNGPNDAFLDDREALAIVYSSEKPVVKLADLTQEQIDEGPETFGAVDNMRVRILPVLGTMPAVMGQTLAAYALCEVGKKPFEPVPAERLSKQVRHKYYQHFRNREEAIGKKYLKDVKWASLESGVVIDGVWVGPLGIESEDVDYLLEIWRYRCVLTGDKLGKTLLFARWDESEPSTADNIILVSAAGLKQYLDKPGGRDEIPLDVRKRVEDRLERCRIRL